MGNAEAKRSGQGYPREGAERGEKPDEQVDPIGSGGNPQIGGCGEGAAVAVQPVWGITNDNISDSPRGAMEMNLIAAAFVKAQKGFAPALKTSTNPHFRSKYADLSACVEAVIDSLNSNGIALMQVTHECDSGVIVETIFLHESGEKISGGKLHVPAAKNDAQGYGSALSYARRYGLMAACGIAPEDDDGNAATRSAPQRQAARFDADGTFVLIANAGSVKALTNIYHQSEQMGATPEQMAKVADACAARKAILAREASQ